MKKINPMFIAICFFLFVFFVLLTSAIETQAKQKFDDILYNLLETYLGTPTYNYFASNTGFYNDNNLNKQAIMVAGKLNTASKNRRAKDISILRSNDINAFAVPGGHIILVGGIYKLFENEDELACVIGHEIGHLEKRHSLKNFILNIGINTITRTLYSKNSEEQQWLKAQYIGFVASRGFSREDELEADTLSLEYMNDAGYDSEACVSFMEKLQSLEAKSGVNFTIESTHPPTSIRIQNMKDWIRTHLSVVPTDNTDIGPPTIDNQHRPRRQ